MNPPSFDPVYAPRIEEAMWGGLLVAITLAMHGFGMLLTLRASNAIKERFEQQQSFVLGMGGIILASWMIIAVHLFEVGVWARFFHWKEAVAASNSNVRLCYYFALMDYTTLGSNYNLTREWRLLEGMIAIAGLLTFAWSTGVLLTLAQDFQDRQLQLLKQRRDKRQLKNKIAHPPAPPARSP